MRGVSVVWVFLLLVATPSFADVSAANTITVSSSMLSLVPSSSAVAAAVAAIVASPNTPPQIAAYARSTQALLAAKLGGADLGWLVLAYFILIGLLIPPIVIQWKTRGMPSKHVVAMWLVFLGLFFVSLSIDTFTVVSLAFLAMANLLVWQQLLQFQLFRRQKPTPAVLDVPGTAHVLALYLEDSSCGISATEFSQRLHGAIDKHKPSDVALSLADLEPSRDSATKLEWLRAHSGGANLVSDVLRMIQKASGPDGSKITMPGIAAVLFDLRDPLSVTYARTFLFQAIEYVEKHPEFASGSNCLSPTE